MNESLQRLNRELSILNTIAQALNREIELEQTLHVVLAQLATLFGLRTGWVFLVHETSGETYLAASHNLPSGLAENPGRMTGDCYCLDSYQAGDLDGAANINVITCTRLQKLVSGTDGLRYHASVPLYTQGEKLGVLNVVSKDWRRLSDDDLRLLYTVGDMLSMAIARTRLFARSMQIGAVEERNRLAREIHDTLAQGLSAIALQLETADALLEPATPDEPPALLGLPQAQQAIQKALILARDNLVEARRSVLDLRAAPLEGATLPEALARLVQSTAHAATGAVNFLLEGDSRPLPIHVEVGLYRIAQEALNNIAHHAAAHQATVQLKLLPTQIELIIQDDGCGFDPNKLPQARFGLVGLTERVNLLGGELQIESSPNAGTQVIVTVVV